MTRKEKAVDRFKNGLRCSEAVLEAWAEDFQVSPDLARKIALPLAGGSGVGGECGALSGAFLVLGLKFGMNGQDDAEGFQRTMGKVRELAQGFKSRHKALNCQELLGLEIFTEAGQKEFAEKKLKINQCVRYVEDAMDLLDEAMSPEGACDV